VDVFLDPGDDRSIITQIHDQLRDAIADGRLPIGTRQTPSRVLAAELEVSRSTVTDAYERLAAEGYVEGRHGGGTVVVGGALPRPPNHAASYSEVVPTLDAATSAVTDPRRSPATT
jgi:GntR family transcriptional regulator / MocR family aminotransferase